jgi:hypothetical protein
MQGGICSIILKPFVQNLRCYKKIYPLFFNSDKTIFANSFNVSNTP